MLRNRLTHTRLRPHARLIKTAWIAYWIVLVGLLHSPKLPPPPIQLSQRGLVAHFTAFALLATGCVLTRQARGGKLSFAWLCTWWVILSGYGALSEILQPLSNRGCDVWDGVADAAGVLVAMILARRYLETAA